MMLLAEKLLPVILMAVMMKPLDLHLQPVAVLVLKIPMMDLFSQQPMASAAALISV